jgi:glucose-1-phosphate thymidylyltransferase
LLGNGDDWGLSFSYVEQSSPDGLAQAFILAENFLDGAAAALILGDNLFYGHDLTHSLKNANGQESGDCVWLSCE